MPPESPVPFIVGVLVQRENVATARPRASLPTVASNGSGREGIGRTDTRPAWYACSVQPLFSGALQISQPCPAEIGDSAVNVAIFSPSTAFNVAAAASGAMVPSTPATTVKVAANLGLM